MSDRLDQSRLDEDPSLAAALRALPAPAPERDGWPRLAARIRRRRIARRIAWTALPAACAAALALAFVRPALRPAPHALARGGVAARTASPAPQAAPAELAALQAQSDQWQGWVTALQQGSAPLDGAALAEAVALQDRIGLVDLQLSASGGSPRTARVWRQRIALLQQLGSVYLRPYTVAEQVPAAAAGTSDASER